MIHKKIFILFFIIFILLMFLNFNFLYSQADEVTERTKEEEFVPSPLDWAYFYRQIRPAADAKCFVGDTALEKITNCIDQVARVLQFLAIIIFVISLTVIAGLFVFSPVKKEYLDIAKKTLIWTIIGFIILFIIRDIMILIQQLAGK